MRINHINSCKIPLSIYVDSYDYSILLDYRSSLESYYILENTIGVWKIKYKK